MPATAKPRRTSRDTKRVFLRAPFGMTFAAIAEAAEVIGLPALRIVQKVAECLGEEAKEFFKSQIPRGEMGRPEEIATVALFLPPAIRAASMESSSSFTVVQLRSNCKT